MNITSYITFALDPIKGRKVHFEINDGLIHGKVPLNARIFEDNGEAEFPLYTSFNLTLLVNVKAIQNINGTALFIDEAQIKDLKFHKDNTKLNHKAMEQFLPFYAQFYITDLNNHNLARPYLQSFVEITDKIIIMRFG